MSAEIFDVKLYKKALKLAKKGKSLKIKPISCVEYEGENQIQIDAEQIIALQKQNGELTDKVKALEVQIERLKDDLELWESGACRATNLDKCSVVKELKSQIEKLKSHSNCKHRSEYNEFDPYSKVCQSCCNLEKWEFGEIKENE